MDFSLSETQQQIKSLAAQIFGDFTTQERLRALDGTGYFSPELWQQLAASGLLGIAVDETHGGMGLDFETLCVMLEEAGRHAAPVPLLPVLAGAAIPLQIYAAEIAGPLLAKLVAGEAFLTAALYETGSSNLLDPQASAVTAGAGWRLTGVKQGVAAAEQASHCWTLARLGGQPALFLVEMDDTTVNIDRQTMTTGEFVGSVRFDNAPATLLLKGEAATDFVERARSLFTVATAAFAVGLCEQMTRMAASYTSERIQFGKPIGTFQAVQHQLADCHIDTECLRAASQQAICRLSGNATAADVDATEIREQVAAAGIWACEALHRVSHRTQQVHGGTGVDRDYGLFRYCLWAKKLELALGGSSRLLEELGQSIAAA